MSYGVLMKILILSAILMASFSALADSNREDDERIFNEEQSSRESQVILGFLEAGGSAKLFETINLSSELKRAEKRLRRANSLLTEKEKRAKLDEIGKRIELIHEVSYKNNQAIINNLSNEIKLLVYRAAVTSEEKEKAIQDASKEINRLRAKGIKVSKLAHSIKSMKIVGGSLLMMDVAGRIIVWNCLDADPTLTPVGTFLFKSAKKALDSEN